MHVAADLPLRHPRAVLLDETLPDPPGGVTLLPRRLRSAVRISSITSRYGPSFGAGRNSGTRFAGGIADSNAWLTARRWTP